MMQNPTTGIKTAVMLILVFVIYISGVTFADLPATGNEHAKTVLPFLLGVIATLIGFYWGNSHKTEQAPGETTTKSKTETTTESTTEKPGKSGP